MSRKYKLTRKKFPKGEQGRSENEPKVFEYQFTSEELSGLRKYLLPQENRVQQGEYWILDHWPILALILGALMLFVQTEWVVKYSLYALLALILVCLLASLQIRTQKKDLERITAELRQPAQVRLETNDLFWNQAPFAWTKMYKIRTSVRYIFILMKPVGNAKKILVLKNIPGLEKALRRKAQRFMIPMEGLQQAYNVHRDYPDKPLLEKVFHNQ